MPPRRKCLQHVSSEGSFPVSVLAPFAIVLENGYERRRLTGEQMSHREHAPLTATLELVKNGIHNICEVIFAGEAAFCNTEIGPDSIFYCIFVEYSVFRHWFNILQFSDHNIVHPLLNALYFNNYTTYLTFIN